LTVNHKREDGHFVDFFSVFGLGDRSRRRDENKGEE
jgi:hypothetical protein